VPLHPTVTEALSRYAAERERFCPRPHCRAFFVSSAGTRLDRSGVSKTLRKITTAELTITDTASGESSCLRGWGLGVSGRSPHGRAGAYEGATHLSVNAKSAPTVGRWYKTDIA
jgi:hypothetical protein